MMRHQDQVLCRNEQTQALHEQLPNNFILLVLLLLLSCNALHFQRKLVG
jgi:hypothetical protein